MSLKKNNENSSVPSSSMSSIHASKHNKHSYTTSTTNRISPPPPNLTINQFQPVFKEARKKKQQLNTKTNDDRKNSDQTLFNTQPDNNYSECITSTEPNSSCSRHKDENHLDCSTNVLYSDGSIKCNNLGTRQLDTVFENKKSVADILDQTTCNQSSHSKLIEQQLDIPDINKSVQPKLDLVVAQSHKDSNTIQCFVVSPSPTCNIKDVKEVFNLHQSPDDGNLLSANNSKDYRQTIVSLHQVNEKKIHNADNFTTSILNEDFPGDISNELYTGYSPSKQPLINETEMGNDKEENGPSMQNVNSMTSTNSSSSTWAANKARRLSLLGQSLIKSSSSKIKSHKPRTDRTFQPEPVLNKKRIGITHISFSSKVKFNKDDDTSSNSIVHDEQDPER